MDLDDLTSEAVYDQVRMEGWLRARNAGPGRPCPLGDVAPLIVPLVRRRPRRSAPASPIVKPLPPELFTRHGSCAEMRWESMLGQGYHVPNDRFFVRNHTSTPLIDPGTWRLRLHGDGLRLPREFTYAELRAMPSTTLDAAIECAGNGRAFFATQQNQDVRGTPWRLGGIGVARWRGVRLAELLERAGLTPEAVDVMPRGLDPEYVEEGANLGRVRRPLPVAKAVKDVLVAYDMNDEPLPPDHGFPARLVVPGWSGISSIKWVGDVEVSTTPLLSPWSTRFYRMFGPDFPPEGGKPVTSQVVKSAFELPWDATFRAGRRYVLRGRSWSGNGHIGRVEVSTDGGLTWRRALMHGPRLAPAWARWHAEWSPTRPGPYVLMARAVDEHGRGQPDVSVYNTHGYLFDAVVRHPVTVTRW
ncbi:Mo-co oxidoreductase dimerisation domain-containing protein [Sinosporangium album]|uniref:Mo-co oxidoreductase dimerisation domain-containing protein n=1 Tax=Sinosporangium album TaxID=504805 RepID=A0A1G7R2T3_9ACTN|nr:sulfite oxidase [Sinosporangium album]SDG04260.1 Mo-co oxidoreductase dimerisation domain-containing protein [Sinosporangium album]